MLLSFLENYHWTLHSSQFFFLNYSSLFTSWNLCTCSLHPQVLAWRLFHHWLIFIQGSGQTSPPQKDLPLSLPFVITTSSSLVPSQQNLSWRSRTTGTCSLPAEFSWVDVSEPSPPTQGEATTFHSSQVISVVSSCLKFGPFILLLVATSQLSLSHGRFTKKAHYLVVKIKGSEIQWNLDSIPAVSLITYVSLGKCFKLSKLQSSYLKEDITHTFNPKIFMEIQVDNACEKLSSI